MNDTGGVRQSKGGRRSNLYDRIYEVVRFVPRGRVTTYGRVAGIVGGCGARQVGYAMASVHEGSDVPWHRVVNSEGKVSARRDNGPGDLIQRQLLEDEGVVFDQSGRINLTIYLWTGQA
jgi:alkylated DNA nucleotide flippase Atl1